MTREHNLEIARKWYQQMWSEPDFDLADEIIDPAYDPEWVHIDKTGPEQVKHEMRYFRSIFPDLVYSVVDAIAAEDRVWVRYRASGTQTGSAWGFPPSGKQVTFEGAAILYISPEGRVVDRWGAFCFYDILADLGQVPPLWELSGSLA